MTKTARPPSEPLAAQDDPPMDQALRRDIELRAYYRHCAGGCVDGCDVDDWLAAEREVRAEQAAAKA